LIIKIIGRVNISGATLQAGPCGRTSLRLGNRLEKSNTLNAYAKALQILG